MPDINSPIRLSLEESLSGIFVDASISADAYFGSSYQLGSSYLLRDELLSGNALAPWYTAKLNEQSFSGGLVSLSGETLLSELARMKVTKPVKRKGPSVYGQPTLTGRDILTTLLSVWSAEFGFSYGQIPDFFMRTGNAVFMPVMQALIIEPDLKNFRSVYDYLSEFFAPFTGYVFRADTQNRLEIKTPYWLEQTGMQATPILPLRSTPGERVYAESDGLYWHYDRSPLVSVVSNDGTGNVTVANGVELFGYTNRGFTYYHQGSYRYINFFWNPTTKIIQWVVYRSISPNATLLSNLHNLRVIFRPKAVEANDRIVLTDYDLGMGWTETISSSSVVNQATVEVSGFEVEENQNVMSAKAVILRSPSFAAPIGGIDRPNANDMSVAVISNTQGTRQPRNLVNASDGYVQYVNVPIDVSNVLDATLEVTFDIEEWVQENRRNGGVANGPLRNRQFSVTRTLTANDPAYTAVATLNYNFNSTSIFGDILDNPNGRVDARWVETATQSYVRLYIYHIPWAYIENLVAPQNRRYQLWAVGVKVSAKADVYQRGATNTYTFGYEQANLPSLNGLATSQQLFGKREQKVGTGVFYIESATAQKIAQGIVETKFFPARIITLTVVPNPNGKYRVSPSFIGQRCVLPNGQQGFIRSWSYTENHEGGSQSSMEIEVEVPISLSEYQANNGIKPTTFRNAYYRRSNYIT